MTEIFVYNVIEGGPDFFDVDCRVKSEAKATTLYAQKRAGLTVHSSGPYEITLYGSLITKAVKK